MSALNKLKKFCVLSPGAKEARDSKPKLRRFTDVTKALGLIAGAFVGHEVGYDLGGPIPIGMIVGGGIGFGFNHAWFTFNRNYLSARKDALAKGDDLTFGEFLND
jgi:F0F1-type ATP synthase assembly protein I